MDLARGYRTKNKIKLKEMKAVGIGFNSDSLLIIGLPDSRVLRIISRSLCLALFILALPSIGSFVRHSASDFSDSGLAKASNLIGFESLPFVFRDLVDEGLLKSGHKVLILSSDIGYFMGNFHFWNDKGIDLVIDSRSESITYHAFDFVFARSSQSTEFINRVLKIDGVLVVLGNEPSIEFQQPANYIIVYIRRFESTVVAMKKISLVSNPQTKRRLLGVTKEAKKLALDRLEDIVLDPLVRALAKPSDKKMKFLPNLLGVWFEHYNRRILITDEKNDILKWFYENYPMCNQDFEIHNLEVDQIADREEGVLHRASGVSDWLMKNVKKEDFVVMKAEARSVEKMIKEKTISLVDELFLECKNQWEANGKMRRKKRKKSKRAYLQCLALYGRLRDEGVAGHQWCG